MICAPLLFILEGKMARKFIAFVSHNNSMCSGPHHGHYVAVVKNNTQWILLDDEDVHVCFALCI